MNTEKILSLIIPTYNMEKYLRKCLDSLIVSEENMQFLEVLVVNDGSKDASSQIAHEFETRYPQTVRVIDKENGNYGSCINCGLNEVTGKYVKVLDADDYFVKDVFDQYVSKLNSIHDNVDLIITDYCQVNEKGETTLKPSFTNYLPAESVFTLDKLTESTDLIHFLIHQNITYRTNILKQINYRQTEGISYTDNEWAFNPFVAVEMVMYFPCCLYSYFVGREGQTFDPKVFYGSIGQREIVMRSIADYYSAKTSSCSPSSKKFLKERLTTRLGDFYYYHLCIVGTKSSCDTLYKFDNELKTKCPEAFDSLNDVSDRLKVHYIRRWRKSGYDKNIPSIKFLRAKEYLKGLKCKIC